MARTRRISTYSVEALEITKAPRGLVSKKVLIVMMASAFIKKLELLQVCGVLYELLQPWSPQGRRPLWLPWPRRVP